MTLIELLEDQGLDHRQHGDSPHVTEGWIGLICPYCGEGTDKYGLGVNLDNLACKCWKCGTHKIWKVLRDLNVPGEAIGELFQDLRRDFVPTDAAPRGRLTLPEGITNLLPVHKAYLTRRGFDPEELVALWKIQGIGLARPTSLVWRIFIPIHLGEKVVSWTTRAISDNTERRYLAASLEEESYPHKDLLYGEWLVRQTIVVVEGPTDVWKLGPGAVATFGTSYSIAQAQRMSRYPVRVICFDNEPEAQRQARGLCELLKPYPGITYNVCLQAKDPGSASTNELNEIRKRFLS